MSSDGTTSENADPGVPVPQSATKAPKAMAPVLWLSLAALWLSPLFADLPNGRVWLAFLIGFTALLALFRSEARPQARKAAVIAVLGAVLAGGLAEVLGDAAWLKTTSSGIYTFLLLITPMVIVYRMVKRPKVTLDTVAAALAAYIQIGLLFASLYEFTSLLTSEPFFAGGEDASPINYTYFSFVTLTTLGYGDLTPATDIGKMEAITESITGSVFLVTVVALVVTNLGRPISRRTDDN